jgi:hypothetical protein
MSVIRVGSNSGYAAGWEAIFGGSKKARPTGGPKAAAKKSAKAGKKRAATAGKKPAAVRKAKNRRRK